MLFVAEAVEIGTSPNIGRCLNLILTDIQTLFHPSKRTQWWYWYMRYDDAYMTGRGHGFREWGGIFRISPSMTNYNWTAFNLLVMIYED